MYAYVLYADLTIFAPSASAQLCLFCCPERMSR